MTGLGTFLVVLYGAMALVASDAAGVVNGEAPDDTPEGELFSVTDAILMGLFWPLALVYVRAWRRSNDRRVKNGSAPLSVQRDGGDK